MTNAKNKGKKGRIVGTILLSIGLIITTYSVFPIYYYAGASGPMTLLWIFGLLLLMLGVIFSVLGLVVLLTSRKKISSAKSKKQGAIIVGIILLVIGLIIIIYFGYSMYVMGPFSYGLLSPIFSGVAFFVIGLYLLITSRKKNSKSLDKSIT